MLLYSHIITLLYYKVIIDDFKNNGCSEEEKSSLIEVFKSIPKTMSISLARESNYDLKDFYNSKNRGIDKFTLISKRSTLEDSEYFTGQFKSGKKQLEVTAYLIED